VTVITPSLRGLLAGGVPAFPAILLTRPSLIVLSPSGQPAPKLEMTFIQHPNPIRRLEYRRPGASAERLDHIGHNGGRLPFSRRDAGIEVGGSGFEQRLAHVGAHSPSPLQPASVGFAHSVVSLGFGEFRSKRFSGDADSSGSTPASLIRVIPEGRPSGREDLPRYSK
jgi:hypothetical protein